MIMLVKNFSCGIKQAAANSFDILKTGLLKEGFHQSTIDPGLFPTQRLDHCDVCGHLLDYQ